MNDNNNQKGLLNDTFTILKLNIGVFLLYTILSSLIGGMDGVFIGAAIAFVHAALALFCGVAMLFIRDYRNTGAALILNSFILAIIGFSFCLGALNMSGI